VLDDGTLAIDICRGETDQQRRHGRSDQHWERTAGGIYAISRQRDGDQDQCGGPRDRVADVSGGLVFVADTSSGFYISNRV